MKKILALACAALLLLTAVARAEFMVNEFTGFNVGGGIGGNDSFTKLLLHWDGSDASTTYVDSSSGAKTVTRIGTSEIDTAQSKFGGSSMLNSTGSSGATIAASADFNMGSGDFTYDFWVRFTGTARGTIFTMGSGNDYLVITPSSGLIEVNSAAGGAIITAGATAFSTATWYHLMLRRSGTSWVLFRDCVSYVTATSSTAYGTSTDLFRIGSYTNNAIHTDGWLEEFRVSKGVARDCVLETQPYD